MSAAGPARPAARWLAGRIVSDADEDPRFRLLAAAGCYTSARVRDGRALFEAYHVRRLRRDARLLGLLEPDTEQILQAFEELGHTAFGPREGIVRLDLRRDAAGASCLFGSVRRLDADPPGWSASVAPFVHPGPRDAPGVKLSAAPVVERARKWTGERGLDECLLFDASGHLVEGARSSLLIVSSQGELQRPESSRGGVAGIALAVLHDRGISPRETPIDAERLAGSREIIAINAVRGAHAITRLDTRSVGGGTPGPWAERLARALWSDTTPHNRVVQSDGPDACR